MAKKFNLWVWGTIGVIVLGGVTLFFTSTQPGEYDEFASCLGENGATFYGAYWCPHCQDQKRTFGRSAKFLPYVECSLPNQAGQTQICIQDGIDSYPTWKFSDGSRVTGVLTPLTLAQKTGCKL